MIGHQALTPWSHPVADAGIGGEGFFCLGCEVASALFVNSAVFSVEYRAISLTLELL